MRVAEANWNEEFTSRSVAPHVNEQVPVTGSVVITIRVTANLNTDGQYTPSTKVLEVDKRVFDINAPAVYLQALLRHELGHAIGFAHSDCPNSSAMSDTHYNDPARNPQTSYREGFTACDESRLNIVIGPPPECDGDCGPPIECIDAYCGGGPPPAPGPSWCSPSLEFWSATSVENCYSICPIDSPAQLWNDQYNSCVGAWESEMCFAAYGGEMCGALYGFSWALDGGGGGGYTAAMSSHSAVRQCSGWSWNSPVYKRTATECLNHCADNDADACEWEAGTGDCYVEFGSGCQVEFGHYGWSAYVFNGGGGSTGGGSSTMTEHNGVTCSDWWWHSPVYKADAEQCGAYCQANGADACEWHAGTGDCYVEFGNGCAMYGAGGWWAAVYNEETEGSAVGPFSAGLSRAIKSLFNPQLLAIMIGVLSTIALTGLMTLLRRQFTGTEGVSA